MFEDFLCPTDHRKTTYIPHRESIIDQDPSTGLHEMPVINGATSFALNTLEHFLRSRPRCKLILIQYIDISGVSRSRLLPIQTFRGLLENDGVHPGSGSVFDMAVPCTHQTTEEIIPYSLLKAKILPDTDTLKMSFDSAGLGNTASVMACVDVMGLDPRALLIRTVDEAREQHALAFQVGTELEFNFMEMDYATVPADQQRGVHNTAIVCRSRYWPVLNEIIVSLAEEGIYAVECHKENKPAQFEIALPPYDPLKAVDNTMYAREVIRNISYRHGLVATFYPSPFSIDAPAFSGAHIHISATPCDGCTNFESDHFLAGMLSHLPALCAIGMPSIDSYVRTAHGSFGAGAYVAWGSNNRFTAIRKVKASHWELRCCDGTANLYLMIVGIIKAGLDAKPLTVKEIDKPASLLSEQELKSFRPLPKSLEEALLELEKDSQWAIDTFGKNLIRFFLANKKHELRVLGDMSEAQRKQDQVHHF